MANPTPNITTHAAAIFKTVIPGTCRLTSAMIGRISSTNRTIA